MDKYIEIQKIFSDFYFKEIVHYIKARNLKYEYSAFWAVFFLSLLVVLALSGLQYITPMMNHEYAWEYNVPGYVYTAAFTLVFLGCPLVAGVGIFFDGYIIADMLNANKVLDKKIKRRFFPDLFKRLGFIEWIDVEPVEYNGEDEELYNFHGIYQSKYRTEIMSILQEHKLVDVHAAFFKVDDVFKGKLNDSDFSIFEVSNKYNIVHMIINSIFYYILGPLFILLMPLLVLKITPLVSFLLTKSLGHIILFAWVMAYDFFMLFVAGVQNTEMSLNYIDNKFRGVVAVFNLNKRIDGNTLIFENHYDNKLAKEVLSRGYEKVSFEDSEFNKRYSVYTTNQVEARYALTTAMMERLKNLHHHFKSKYIRASFKDDKLVIAIQADKDLFRLISAWRETYSKDYQTMFLELISILKITDALNLQNDTGL